MTNCTVEDCPRPTSDRLCAHHLGLLVTALRAVATGPEDVKGVPLQGLYADLQDVVCGRVSLGSGASVASTATEAPLPYTPSASDLASVLDNTLATWLRDVAGDYVRGVTTTVAAAAWLAEHPVDLATHPAADELYDEIIAVVREVERQVDRRPDRVYLGTCGAWVGEDRHEFDVDQCPAQLYARPGAAVAICRTCGTRYDVAERRAWMLGSAEDALLTAVDCARALSGLGDAVSVNTIRQWKHRGRLVAHGHDGDRPLYRLGDIIDLLAAREVVA